jgi:hypothetical protein
MNVYINNIVQGMVENACYLYIQEIETGRLQVQRQSELHSKFRTNPNYKARPCLKKTTKTNKQKIYILVFEKSWTLTHF